MRETDSKRIKDIPILKLAMVKKTTEKSNFLNKIKICQKILREKKSSNKSSKHLSKKMQKKSLDGETFGKKDKKKDKRTKN